MPLVYFVMAKGKKNPSQIYLADVARYSPEHLNKEINMSKVEKIIHKYLAEYYYIFIKTCYIY